MKTPRLTDFDPNAKVPELASPLEGYPTIARPEPKPTVTTASSESPTRETQASDSTIASKLDSKQASMIDSTLASSDIITLIRKAVRQTGKEVSFVRLTPEEKKQLGDVIYTYKGQGIKTSENEITRIAVNFLLEDYRQNGLNSVLQKVMEALLA